MTHLRLAACLAVLLAAPAAAHEDGPSKIPTEAEFYKEAGLEPGMVLPGGTNLADFAESTREPGPKGNETPGMVRTDIQDLKEQKMMNDFLNPQESVIIEKQLEVAEIRLAIAEKRMSRDRLRKTKKNPREIGRLEREIHALKTKLAMMAPAVPKNGLADMFKSGADED